MTMPVLQQAIINNDFDAFSQALAQGTDINQLDPVMGNSPLHIAAQQTSTKWVEALLKAGAFINLQTPKHGVTPLMISVWHRKPQVTKLLLSQPDINTEIISTFSLKAAQLIDFGASKDDSFGLEQAQMFHSLFNDYAKRLADTQAKMLHFNLVTSDGSDSDKAEAILALEDHSALNIASPITSSGNDEHTAVMVAARDGQVESLKVLMELDGDQTIPDHYMKAIPLHKAAYNGHPEVIELLSRFGGFKETLDAQGPNNGYTPLHDAIWHGHTQAAANLINAGARTDLRGFDGKTPLELAKEYQYTSIVEMLEKK
ncbi:ankyrin 2,3/unc44 [Vibrio ishigakensis]|uniref:Ankyrin 2,3/unc44 n=1 Tax=Vibrio ishigakensis TaxID=1481914 RepID=A0A0B8PF74_9VIBR|nr:ankyrin 2,3/unc44 [Vibrio ishigakensis]